MRPTTPQTPAQDAARAAVAAALRPLLTPREEFDDYLQDDGCAAAREVVRHALHDLGAMDLGGCALCMG